jgi:subtilisin-like proprotein convertase family protein
VYSEPGACVLACAPSDNDLFTGSDDGIYTTTGATGYTASFGGTSAAAPIASGVVALMLDANPCLTWRDVQHIFVETSRRNDATDVGWVMNGAGRYVHERYGYGALDAGAATAAAAGWEGVAPEVTVASATSLVGAALPNFDPLGVTRQIVVDSPLTLESVEVTVNVSHANIGDLSIVLTSPSGTESVFARPRQDFGVNYTDYLFTSVRHWGEPSVGAWTLTIADEAGSNEGAWLDWRIALNGTEPGAAVCPCEWDGAAGVTVFDLLGYLDGWFAVEGSADLDCSGTVDVFDLLDYLDCWFGGCV